MTSKRTSIGEASIETRLLYERLVQLQVDEVVTYQELNQICGGDTQHEQRGYLYTARKQAEQEGAGMILDCVRGVGIKRLAPAGINGVLQKHRESEDRRNRKTLKRTTKVVLTDLPPQERAMFTAEVSLLSMKLGLGKKKPLQLLQQKAAEAGNFLNPQKVIEVYSQNKPQESA